MKTLKETIFEALRIKTGSKIRVQKSPIIITSRKHLIETILSEVEENGYNCDLNHLDVSKVTDFSHLFIESTSYDLRKFNGNISDWDVSNAVNMNYMFYDSDFSGENGDISNWDVSKCKNFESMFRESNYDGDLSKWDVSSGKKFTCMFYNCIFTGRKGPLKNWNMKNANDLGGMFGGSNFTEDISNWDVSNVTGMSQMFMDTQYNHNLENWNVKKLKYANQIFDRCPVRKNLPKWAYKFYYS